MSDSETSKIEVFGTTYEVTDGTIRLNHTLTVEQARDLEDVYPTATGLQEAIRTASQDGTHHRRNVVTTTETRPQMGGVRELGQVNREILQTLQNIEESLGD